MSIQCSIIQPLPPSKKNKQKSHHVPIHDATWMNCKRSQTQKGTYYANPFIWSVWDRWNQKDRKQVGGFKELKSGTEWGITALQVCGDKNKKWSAVWWENPRGLWELSAGQRPACSSEAFWTGLLIGRTDAEAEAPILWPPAVNRWLIGKDPDDGKDWQQKGKRVAEDEMVG